MPELEINIKEYKLLFIRRNFLEVLKSALLGNIIRFVDNEKPYYIMSHEVLQGILEKGNMELKNEENG